MRLPLRGVFLPALLTAVFGASCNPAPVHPHLLAFSSFTVSPAFFFPSSSTFSAEPAEESAAPPQKPQEPVVLPPPAAPAETMTCHRVRRGRFGGRFIAETLTALQTAPILQIIPSRTAGRTVKATLHLAGEWRAFFKPLHRDVIFARPKAEVGAYRLNRLLGRNYVPPAVIRDIDAQLLRRAFERDGTPERVKQLDRQLEKGAAEIRGALLVWVDDADVWDPPAELLAAMEAVDVPLPEPWAVPAWDLSWMFMLDFLTNNYDRFTGGNILRRRADGRLVFIDNGAGFGGDKPWKAEKRRATLKYLGHYHADFRMALERLTLPLLQDCLGDIIFTWELRGVLERRDELLEYFRKLETSHPGSVLRPVDGP